MKKLLYITAALLVALAACKKPDVTPDPSKEPSTNPSEEPSGSPSSDDPSSSPESELKVSVKLSDVYDIEGTKAKVDITITVENNKSDDVFVAVFCSDNKEDFHEDVAELNLKIPVPKQTVELYHLDPATTYYVLAGVEIDDAWTNSNVVSFTMPESPQLNIEMETGEADEIRLHNAILYGSATVTNAPAGWEPAESWFYLSSKEKKADDIISNGMKFYAGTVDDPDISSEIEDLEAGTKYYYVLSAEADGKVFHGDVRSFTTKSFGEVAKAVDLGLSVKWADVNLGSEYYWDNEEYFAWGETMLKYEFTVENYSLCEVDGSCNITVTKYTGKNGSDTAKKLSLSDDTAYKLMGREWKMPTKANFDELIEKCIWEWVSSSSCYKVTGPSGESIYLPVRSFMDEDDLHWNCMGKLAFYWASDFDYNSDEETFSYALRLNTTWYKPNYTYVVTDLERYYGCAIRAVARE